MPLSKEKAEKHASPRGTLYMWRPLPAVMVTRVEGTFTMDGAIAVQAFMRRMVTENGKFAIFNDWEAMTDYDTAARTGITRAAVELRRSLEAVHILVTSPLVALGVETANLVVKIITVHRTRAMFDQTLRTALGRRP